jgi:hypothetical protein
MIGIIFMSDPIVVAKVAEGLIPKIQELSALFLNPGVEELGLWLRDRIRIYRLENLAKVLSKANARLMLDQGEIKPIRLKEFLALAEACSMEDEDEMIERWSNLLVSSIQGNPVLPSYIRVLAELTSGQAQVLDLIHQLQADIGVQKNSQYKVFAVEIANVRAKAKFSEEDFWRIVGNLERLNLICRRSPFESMGADLDDFAQPGEDYFGTTGFAEDFLAAVARPAQP